MRDGWDGINSGDSPEARRRRDLHPMIAELRSAWERLRPTDGLPAVHRIDPRGIRGALPGAFLLRQIAPQQGRLEIAGQNVTDLLGMEARGMPISALFDPLSRLAFGPLLAQVFAGEIIADLRLDCETGIGRPALSARMILLPLADCPNRGRNLLGCLALSGSIGQVPRRLNLRAQRSERLNHPMQPRVPSFAVKDHPKARPWLRLVDLGR